MKTLELAAYVAAVAVAVVAVLAWVLMLLLGVLHATTGWEGVNIGYRGCLAIMLLVVFARSLFSKA